MSYTELQVTSNFSFLRGASHPEELVEHAVALGYTRIAITDRNSLAGIVRAHVAAKKLGISILPATRLDLLDGPALLAYPINMQGYTRLSALLTLGNLRAEKGSCHLYCQDVYDHEQDLVFICLPPTRLNSQFAFDPLFVDQLRMYKKVFGDRLYLAATRGYRGDDSKQLHQLHRIALDTGVPLVATNDVHYHDQARRKLQDVVTCVREKCTITDAGFRLEANAERYLKPIEEMIRLFRQYPDAIARSQEIADRCQFSLDELKYQYPRELTSEGRSPQEELTFLAWQGAHERYGDNIPEKISSAIHYELAFMEEMNYAEYFLTVYDIVRFAREQRILCQGRGSAANSTVCYCLGITSVDPTKFDLLFERFISSARNEPPDIDVDFEHERREEVIQYIYQKYGRDRAAIVATVTQQHQRGAIRDVGKAMGLSVDTINRLSASIWEFTDEWFEGKRLVEQGFKPGDEHLLKVLQLTREFMGFPRQLGQHTGGFVITQGKLSDLCPILNARMPDRTNIEWNKDDIDALGFLKIDVLALGMLTCIRKGFDLAQKHYGLDLTLANIPQDDPAVYDMICHADTIGVFQIESRAQQSMLPRLKPRCFYDLVIEVAIVRPGPIQGDMVHPYLRRRNGEEPVEYPSKDLEDILGRTLGVPLFQEQAMKIAIIAAGFTPAEADELRRSMATFKAKGLVAKFEEKLTRGMLERGYELEYAQRVFRQLEGFGSYGFPESHAASFALLVYVSSWVKWYYPDVFACSLLNSMPMGFYQPAQIVIDARKHGVEVRPVDINFSTWDNLLEDDIDADPEGHIDADPKGGFDPDPEGGFHPDLKGGFDPDLEDDTLVIPDQQTQATLNAKKRIFKPMRLGFRQVKGLREIEMNLIVQARQQPYTSVNQLRDLGIPEATLKKLADADAFRSIQLDRRQALWEVATQDRPVELFAGQPAADSVDEHIQLPRMSVSEHVVHDYASTSLSLKEHPVYFVREKLEQLRIRTTRDLADVPAGQFVKVAGLVLVRQRPGTAGGICFMTIEDETGFANMVLFESIFEKFRKAVLQSRLIMVEGRLQREGEVIHVIASGCYDLSRLLRGLTPANDENLPLMTLSGGDETSIPAHAQIAQAKTKKLQAEQVAQEKLFPDARNFR